MTWPELMARLGGVLFTLGDIACACLFLWVMGELWHRANERYRGRP